MMLCNKTITVFSREPDPAGMDRYHHRVLTGVFCREELTSDVGVGGQSPSRRLTVRVPVKAGHPPVRGDLIVRGSVGRDFDSAREIVNICGESWTVADVIDNTQVPRGAHIRVVAV